MAGRVKVDGTLCAGPPSGADGVFPALQAVAPLFIGGGSSGRSFQVATGVLTRRVNSPAAFVSLSEVGPNGSVTRGEFLYLKTSAPMVLRISTKDDPNPDAVAEIPVNGVTMLEFPSVNLLALLEIQGSGDIEYFVSGQQ